MPRLVAPLLLRATNEDCSDNMLQVDDCGSCFSDDYTDK